MNKTTLSLLLLLLSAPVFAWTIGPMNYQGRLLDNAGVPVTATLPFKVRIYDAASGGTLKFSEQHNSVVVDDGVYSFLVSTGTNSTGAWDIALWNTAQLFMEIEVNSETLTPRHLMAAAPYAFQANLALTTNNALALGGKPSSWFDSTLEAICVSGKGKWLELANDGAGDCLGVGASFPGPTRVNWNTLTASNNFKDLDLSRADISGINFGSPSIANMTNTLFNATTYSVAGMSGANLTNTYWDGAIATDASAFSIASTTNITKATMKNMDMSKWNMSLIVSFTYTQQFSAAFLSACPAANFTASASNLWECRLMRPAGSSYFMLGASGNFSATSAAAINSNGETVLDLDIDAFDNANVGTSNFSGVAVMQDFTNAVMQYSDFSYAKLANITLGATTATGSDFTNSEWDNVVIQTGAALSANDFSNARLSHIKFDVLSNNNNFSYAVLKGVDFNANIQRPNFTGAVLEDVQISILNTNPTIFDGTRIHGNFHINSINSTAAPSMTFKDIVFSNATVSGALTDTNFTGTLTIKNTVFKNLDLCSTSFPLAASAPHAELSGVRWEGLVECPDATDVVGSSTLYSGTCNYTTRMTPVSSTTACNTGIPGVLQ